MSFQACRKVQGIVQGIPMHTVVLIPKIRYAGRSTSGNVKCVKTKLTGFHFSVQPVDVDLL